MPHADERAEDSLLHRGHLLYKAALQECRSTHDLRYLQPGRFICPGLGSDAPFLWFCPLAVGTGSATPGLSRALLEQRTTSTANSSAAACSTPISPRSTGRSCSSTCWAPSKPAAPPSRTPPASSASSRRRSTTVARPPSPGRSPRGSSPWEPDCCCRPPVPPAMCPGHVADAVRAADRESLVRCHQGRPRPPPANPGQLGRRSRSTSLGASVTHRVATSILSTRDSVGRHEETTVERVVLGEQTVRPFFLGNVPVSKPPDHFWSDRLLRLPVFRPLPIHPLGSTGIPHLNLNQVLDDAIGDLL